MVHLVQDGGKQKTNADYHCARGLLPVVWEWLDVSYIPPSPSPSTDSRAQFILYVSSTP